MWSLLSLRMVQTCPSFRDNASTHHDGRGTETLDRLAGRDAVIRVHEGKV
jgi:hypothetical protein